MGKHTRASSRRSLPARKKPQQISRINPVTTTDETPREATRRRAQAGKMVDPAVRRKRRLRVTITVLVVLGVLLVAGAAYGVVWFNNLNTEVHSVYNANPELAKVLDADHPPPPGEPFYAVLMGSDTRKGEKQQRSDTLIVARIDPKNKSVRMISIPRDTRADVPGVGMTKINAAAFFGGTALTIKTVKQFTGLPIKYFVNIDFGGFRDVVDSIGGVWINVPVAINDRQASAWGAKYMHIKKGYQKLNGYFALTFVRARHQFADQDFSRMKDQQIFIKALAHQTLQLSNVFRAPAIINAVGSHMQTNMSPTLMATLVLQFKGIQDQDIEAVTMPGVSDYVDGQSYVVPDDDKFAEILKKFKAGERITPRKAAKGSTGKTVAAHDVPLTIRNGAGVSGMSKQAQDFFTLKGFKVSETGNMPQFVYGKTLVVYSKGNETKANFVRDQLGFGDVVPAAGLYVFKTPVMVVIGKNWKDPSTASTRRGP